MSSIGECIDDFVVGTWGYHNFINPGDSGVNTGLNCWLVTGRVDDYAITKSCREQDSFRTHKNLWRF
jgi:hypothetical protein